MRLHQLSSMAAALIGMFFYSSVQAAPVSVEKVRAASKQFMLSLKGSNDISGIVSYNAGQSTAAPVYLVNFSGGGFVLVSGDDSARPILGFSDRGTVEAEELAPALQGLMAVYQREITENKHKPQSRKLFSPLWNSVTPQYTLSRAASVVAPLLERDGDYNAWGQGAPYNKYTPLEGGQKTWVGCGALSTGQILWYWQHPKVGKGVIDTINYGKTEYRWDLMPAKLSESSPLEEIDAVSTMLYHLGVAMKMRYHYPDPSLTHPSEIAPALGDQEEYGEIIPGYFRYHAVYNDGFIGTAGVSQTAAVLMQELNAQRPVQFNALKNAGHAFVCDGYDTKGETDPVKWYYHFNFGWDGQDDGWFVLSAIGPVHGADKITFIPNYKIVQEIYPLVESCSETSCSGHGTCSEASGIPECLCDNGYAADTHFRCLKQAGETDSDPASDAEITDEADAALASDESQTDTALATESDTAVSEGAIDTDTAVGADTASAPDIDGMVVPDQEQLPAGDGLIAGDDDTIKKKSSGCTLSIL